MRTLPLVILFLIVATVDSCSTSIPTNTNNQNASQAWPTSPPIAQPSSAAPDLPTPTPIRKEQTKATPLPWPQSPPLAQPTSLPPTPTPAKATPPKGRPTP